MAAKDKTLQDVLDRLSNSGEPLDDHEIYDAISRRLKEDREDGKPPSLEGIAEWSAFMFCPEYHWKHGGWESYYGPMWAGTTADGTESYTPDINQFDYKSFEYWVNRARDAKHPVLKVRYADLCWEFQKRITGVAPSIDLARVVIDSTIDAASRRLVTHEVNGKKKLARALSISLGIGDAARINSVRDAIVAYEDAVARDDAAGLWGFSYDLILEERKIPKSEALELKIISDLEKRLTRVSAIREGKPVDAWGAEYAAIRLAKYHRRQNKHDDVRRVLLAYGSAFEQLAQGASGMLASGWMQRVHNRYCEFGLRSEAEAVLLKVREAAKRSHDEMATHTDKIEIPKQEMEAYLEQFTTGTLSDGLNRIAGHFLASKKEVVDQLKKIQKSAPLMSMLAISIVDGEGRPAAQIGSVDDDLEGRVAYQMSQNMQFSRMFLYLAIDRVRERFQPSVDDLVAHLRQSPVFPDDCFAMLRPGLQLYFNNDHLSAAHVLIPQIEASLRHLLNLCGANLWKPHRGGGMMLKNLDDVLRETAIAESLTEDGVLNLRVLLTDQRGWNVRNGVCHGLLTPESFGRGMTDRLLHVLLFLSLIRMKQGQGTKTGNG